MKLKNFYSSKKISAELLFVLRGSIVISEVSETIYDLLGFQSSDFLNGKLSLKNLIHSDDKDISNNIFAKKNTPKFNQAYVKNFNWVSTWFNINKIQLLEHLAAYLIPIIFIAVINYKSFFQKKNNKLENKNNNKIFIITNSIFVLLGLFVWFTKSFACFSSKKGTP